jgi:hypothetical protein
MVAACTEGLHSSFRGRKPRRWEDYKRRTRKPETVAAGLASTLHSLSRGRKPRRRETRCKGKKTTKGRVQELVNPASN